MLVEINAIGLLIYELSKKHLPSLLKTAKKEKDSKSQIALDAALDQVESFKDLRRIVDEGITAAFQGVSITDEYFQIIVEVEKNPSLKERIANTLLSEDFSAEALAEHFIQESSQLNSIREILNALMRVWIDSMDKVISSRPQLYRIVSLKSSRTQVSLLKQTHQVLALHTEAINRMSNVFDESIASKQQVLNSVNSARFERANEFLRAGSLIKAETEFRSLLEDFEKNPQTVEPELKLRSFINLGTTLWELHDHDQAAYWLESAYRFQPQDWRAKRGYAFVLKLRGKPDDALKLVREVRVEKPTVENFCNEAWFLMNTGRAQEAVLLLEGHAFEEESFYSTLSYAYLKIKRYEDAEAIARKALALDPNSESALGAISFAIAFPILVPRMHRQTVELSPSSAEVKRLKDAIHYAEKSAGELRKRERNYILQEVLTNLSSFYAAIGDYDHASTVVDEGMRLNPKCHNLILNQWVVKIGSKNYKGAMVTASLIEELIDPIDGWCKKAIALMLDDNNQGVVDSWESRCEDPDFSKNPDVAVIAARALSLRFKTDEALALLEAILSQNPSNALVLCERGYLFQTLGKDTEAEASFLQAETLATSHDRRHVLGEFAYFLYSKHKWKEAAIRFKELGANSPYNPLFINYLHCLYNQGDFEQSLALAEESISLSVPFIEDCYGIAANCHLRADNLGRAIWILDYLIQKRTAKEQKYRKRLGQLCWRIADYAKAYDVLIKYLKNDPNDLEVLILLSALCSRLKKQTEALLHARSATKFHPNEEQAHFALANAAFSCPPGFVIENEMRAGIQESLEYLSRNRPDALRPIPVEPGCETLIEMLKSRSKMVRDVESMYSKHPIPIGLFAKQIGRSIVKVWDAFIKHSDIKFRISLGDPQEYAVEDVTIEMAENISIDLPALLTLQHLNLLRHLPASFKEIFAHTAILAQIVSDIEDITLHRKTGSIFFADGSVKIQEISSENLTNTLSFLEAIRDFLKGPSVILVGLAPERYKSEPLSQIVDGCGLETIAPFLVAKELKAICYSDEGVIRTVARKDLNIASFSTLAFLGFIAKNGFITSFEYQDALLKLIESNYSFIPEDSAVLTRLYVRSGGQISDLARLLINRVNNPLYNPSSCLPILAIFTRMVWMNVEPNGGTTREIWISEIWSSILKAPQANDVIVQFVGILANLCDQDPHVFTGILVFSMGNIPQLKPHKPLLFLLMQGAIDALAGLTARHYSFWPALSSAWKQQGEINRLLARMDCL